MSTHNITPQVYSNCRLGCYNLKTAFFVLTQSVVLNVRYSRVRFTKIKTLLSLIVTLQMKNSARRESFDSRAWRISVQLSIIPHFRVVGPITITD